MRPPFEITPRSAHLLADIERTLGRFEGAMTPPANPMLRRDLQKAVGDKILVRQGDKATAR